MTWLRPSAFRVERLAPIIRPHMDGRMGDNVNGPSLIRVPEWIAGALGRYYLYFAAHEGTYIRLACADRPEGPWSVHEPGTLDLEGSGFRGHIASPDVHVVDGEIRMYFHGISDDGSQETRVARSNDGLAFTVEPEILGASYMRAFQYREAWYALAMPGVVYRSEDGLRAFEQGPTLFTPAMRHAALTCTGDRLLVLYTNRGACPEQILAAEVDLTADWTEWREGPTAVVLEPEEEYEGALLPLRPSRPGAAPEPVRELRDPFVFVEGADAWLLYAVAGERGIAIARLYESA